MQLSSDCGVCVPLFFWMRDSVAGSKPYHLGLRREELQREIVTTWRQSRNLVRYFLHVCSVVWRVNWKRASLADIPFWYATFCNATRIDPRCGVPVAAAAAAAAAAICGRLWQIVAVVATNPEESIT